MLDNEDRFRKVKAHHARTVRNAVKEGRADSQLFGFLEFVASTEKYFTSSSCAGRIVLLRVNARESKQEAAFHRNWHRAVSAGEVQTALAERTANEIWLKQEPFILHIGAGSLEGAKKILSAASKTGIKRAGIMVAKEGKFIVELMGTQYMSLPLKKGGRVLVDADYLDFVVGRANKKLGRNYSLLKKFEKKCREELR